MSDKKVLIISRDEYDYWFYERMYPGKIFMRPDWDALPDAPESEGAT